MHFDVGLIWCMFLDPLLTHHAITLGRKKPVKYKCLIKHFNMIKRLMKWLNAIKVYCY